ncbi:hypothetical protein Cantr_05750 [Candida viswanathii]|uniref:Uncharacterized protein n=1 Tax=Candida viswanathii TaxID=5486 RepID=A0A367XSH8_9ASCO|nr:hypothetical protein Cantr_05750 [Candida viswanathii]
MLPTVRQQARISSRSIQHTIKRFNSSHHHDDHHGDHHHEPESKPVEITFAKIFGVAALAGGFLVYKNKDSTDKPLFASKYFDEITNGERNNFREELYDRRYKVGFLKTFDRDNSGIGENLRKTGTVYELPNYNTIPAHSPFGYQFGVGIRTQELGPRRERKDGSKLKGSVRAQHVADIPANVPNPVRSAGAIYHDEAKTKFAGSAFHLVADSKEDVIEFLKKDIYYREGIWDINNVVINPIGVAVRLPKKMDNVDSSLYKI